MNAFFVFENDVTNTQEGKRAPQLLSLAKCDQSLWRVQSEPANRCGSQENRREPEIFNLCQTSFTQHLLKDLVLIQETYRDWPLCGIMTRQTHFLDYLLHGVDNFPWRYFR